MSAETFAHVSNLVIPTATVIYVLAMVAHAMEWATGRAAKVPAEKAAEVLVGAGGATTELPTTGSSVVQ